MMAMNTPSLRHTHTHSRYTEERKTRCARSPATRHSLGCSKSAHEQQQHQPCLHAHCSNISSELVIKLPMQSNRTTTTCTRTLMLYSIYYPTVDLQLWTLSVQTQVLNSSALAIIYMYHVLLYAMLHSVLAPLAIHHNHYYLSMWCIHIGIGTRHACPQHTSGYLTSLHISHSSSQCLNSCKPQSPTKSECFKVIVVILLV